MKIDEYYGWAIDSNSLEGHGLIGRYWWFDNGRDYVPEKLEGHHIVLFKTRKIARKNLTKVKSTFQKAAVKKVYVTISVGFARKGKA